MLVLKWKQATKIFYISTTENNEEKVDNMMSIGNQKILTTEESDDFSRAHPSGEKKKIKLEKGGIFENSHDSPRRSEKIEDSWFFKVLNELFSPNEQ